MVISENQVVLFEQREVVVKQVAKTFNGEISYLIVEDSEGNKILVKEYQIKTVLLG